MRQHLIGPLTKRLAHRAFELDDAADFLALNSDPAVMRHTGEPLLETLAEAQQAIAEYPDFARYGFGRWACVLRATNRPIGFCGLKYLSDLDEVDIGYRFMPQYWGQGLATEACQACLEYGFAEIGISRIIGLVLPDNEASIRVLEKAGMQCVGPFNYDGLTTIKYEACA